VSPQQARRIAVRAQLLDGTARSVLETVRHLGFLQLDPIARVATPQQLVLWSRLGPFDPGELDRLLWNERELVEWNAFIWPIETLPLIHARMRRARRAPASPEERRARELVRQNPGFRHYLLRELELRGPLLSRQLDDRSRHDRRERSCTEAAAWRRCSKPSICAARWRSPVGATGSGSGSSRSAGTR
jgi:uncharacterized protein YcaQ